MAGTTTTGLGIISVVLLVPPACAGSAKQANPGAVADPIVTHRPPAPVEPWRAPDQLLADWIETTGSIFVLSSSGEATCQRIAVTADPGTRTAGHWGDSYRFAIAAGWLALSRAQPSDKLRFTSTARAALDASCRESFAIQVAQDGNRTTPSVVRLGGSAVFRDRSACLEARPRYAPLHSHCEDLVALLARDAPTAAWNALYDKLAGGLRLSTAGPPPCNLEFKLDATAASERFSPVPLHDLSGWMRMEVGGAPPRQYAFNVFPGPSQLWLTPVGSGPDFPVSLAMNALPGGATVEAGLGPAICKLLNTPQPSAAAAPRLASSPRSGQDALLERLASGGGRLVVHVPMVDEAGLDCQALALDAHDGGRRGLLGSPEALATARQPGSANTALVARYEILDGALTVTGGWVDLSMGRGATRADGHGCQQRFPLVAGDDIALHVGNSAWYFRHEDCTRALGQVAPTQLQCPVLTGASAPRSTARTFLGETQVFRRAPALPCAPMTVRRRTVSEPAWGGPLVGELQMAHGVVVPYQIFASRWLWLGTPDGSSPGRVLPFRLEGGNPNPAAPSIGEAPPELIHLGSEVWYPSRERCEAER